MNKILEKYVVKDNFGKDINPKVIRTLIWRTICNMTKHTPSQELIIGNSANIAVSAVETLQKARTDSGIINSCVMTLYNTVFIPVFSHYQELRCE